MTEADTLSIAGSFSGPSDDLVTDWEVFWGYDNFQGTVTPLPTDPSATSRPSFTGEYSNYAEPGTYQLAIAVQYEEDNQSDWLVSYTTIAVTEATPTFTVSGDPDPVNVGDTYALSPYFADPGGDAPLYMSVDWGDGLGNDAPNFRHVFQTVPPGGVAHITATAYTEDGTYTASQDVTVTNSAAPPSDTTLSISALRGAAYEYGQVPDTFRISRTGDTSQPLTASFNLGGDAVLGTEYTVSSGADGQVLSGSATIPVGASFADVLITPLEDHTPDWTDTMTGSLTGGSGYVVDPQASTATTEIVDHDLGLYLGNGSGNIILQGSSDGTQNLVPLVTDFPQEAKQGAQVTLTVTQPGEVNVWTTATPGPNDTPILGDVNGTNVASVVETYNPTDPLPATLWVGGTNGSAAMNDIQFAAYATDATAATPPSSPTSTQAATNPGTSTHLRILMLSDPNNSGDGGAYIDGKPHSWLVGQMAWLAAELDGPAGLVRGAAYSWDTPPGDVLRSVSQTAASRGTVPLTGDDGGNIEYPEDRNPLHTGLKQQNLKFFWASTTATQPHYDTDVVTAHAVLGDTTYSASTEFDVNSPIVANDQLQIGAGGTDAGWTKVGLFQGATDPLGNSTGVVYLARVSVPPGFADGAFEFGQTIRYTTTYQYDLATNGGKGYHSKSPPTQWGLDTFWPAFANLDPSDAPSGWKTGAIHFDEDAPLVSIGNKVSVSDNDAFTTYVMFQPTGAESQWVAVASGAWSYSLAAAISNGKWVWQVGGKPTPTTPATVAMQRATAEPTWSYVVNFRTDMVQDP